jgi:hypothetical protein
VFVKGRAFAFQKAFLLLRILLSLVRFAFVYKPIYLFTSGSLAASLAWPASALARVTQVVYAFEPHSLFLLEQGRFSSQSVAYRLMVFFEKRVMRGRSCLFTGTEAGVRWVKESAPKAWVKKLPTSADEELFQFSSHDRTNIRQQLACETKQVITYVGKFGDLYLGEELIAFFAACKAQRDDLFFLILTPAECQNRVTQWLKNTKLQHSDYFLGSCALSDLPKYLSAADMGIVAYANMPSRTFTSPTKSGNYLLCGLPYAVQKDTSEDAEILARFSCGYTISSYALTEVEGFLNYMKSCDEEDRNILRVRCRNAGLAYRGMNHALQEYVGFFT